MERGDPGGRFWGMGGVLVRGRSIGVFVVATVLAATSCGARLSPEERAAALDAGRQGESEAGSTAAEPAAAGDRADGGQLLARSVGGVSELPRLGAAFDNGGATDIGVTREQITIATVADVTGPIPGLAKSAHQAIAALVAYVNSEGGIYGRALRPLLLDSREDPIQTQAAVSDACERAFAMVGSASAFDHAGAQPGAACGIPDLSGITVTAARASSPNVFAATPVRPDYVPIGPARFFRDRFPDETGRAATLWLNTSTTRTFASAWRTAYERVGFRFIYEQEVQILEGNYSPFVYAMRDAGVEWLTLWADDLSMARMLQAMDQAGWRPRIIALPPTAHTWRFLARAGASAEGVTVITSAMPFEEAGSNPEMQLYLRWLGRAAPGAKPDYWGLLAWSAGRMFVRAALAAGPRLTRAGLFEQLRRIRSWDGLGTHAPSDVGAKRTHGCFILLEIRAGRFARVTPSRGVECGLGGNMVV